MVTTDYVTALRRRLPVVVVIAVAAAALGFVTAPSRPPATKYKATAVLAVRSAAAARPAIGVEAVNADIVAGFVSSGDVPARAQARLGKGGTPEGLASQVETVPGRSGVVNLSTIQPSEREATAVASAFATELVDYLQQRQDRQVQAAVDELNEQLAQLQARSTDLDQQLAGAPPGEAERIRLTQRNLASQSNQVQQSLQQLERFRGGGNAPVTQVGGVSAAPVDGALRPPTGRLPRTVIAALLGLLLGGGLALIMDRLDPTLRTKAQAELAFGLPVIAEVPKTPERKGGTFDVVMVSAPRSEAAEAYRNLRSAISLMTVPGAPSATARNGHEAGASDEAVQGTTTGDSAGGGRAVIIVTSPGPGDGKTETAVNLAASFAEAGSTALLVGADMRHPAVHRYFGLSEGTAFAGGGRRSDDAQPLEDLVQPTSIPGLSVVPGGFHPNPAELLAAQREQLTACRRLAEVVVVDTPPVLVANDAVELMQASDAVVLVGRCGHTTSEAASRASELLRRLGMPTVGVVMIGLTGLPPAYRRYYDERTPGVPRAGESTGTSGFPGVRQ